MTKWGTLEQQYIYPIIYIKQPKYIYNRLHYYLTTMKLTKEEIIKIKNGLDTNATVQDFVNAVKNQQEYKRYDKIAKNKLNEIINFFNRPKYLKQKSLKIESNNIGAIITSEKLSSEDFMFLTDPINIYHKFYEIEAIAINNKIKLRITLDYKRRAKIVGLLK